MKSQVFLPPRTPPYKGGDSLKKRLDLLLVERKLAETRNKAQALIMAGQVTVSQQEARSKKQEVQSQRSYSSLLASRSSLLKPGTLLPEDCAIEIKELPRFVSRGGEKLQAALDHWKISVQEKVCLDIGSSTGGFTDCLLQNRAKKVYAVDVGRKQMHPKLRSDPRVELYEETHILHWTPPWTRQIRETRCEMQTKSLSHISYLVSEVPSLVTMDLSFISLRKVLPRVIEFLKIREDSLSFSELRLANFAQRSTLNAQLLVLLKPQFEVGPRYIRKGVVRDMKIRQEAIESFLDFCLSCYSREGGNPVFIDHFPCPVLGAKGNQEEWIYLGKREW